MQEPGKLDLLDDRFKAYLTTSIQLLKLETVQRSALLASGLFSRLLIILSALITLIFLSVGASLFLAVWLGRYDLGFGIVAGFYLLVTLILILARKKFAEKPLRNTLVKKMLSDD